MKMKLSFALLIFIASLAFSPDIIGQKSKKKPTKKAKRYVMFCGQQYEYYEGINFKNSIPPGSEDRIGYASFRMYKEALDNLYYIGFNNDGILLEGKGNITGQKHTFLLSCDGTIY